MAEPVPGTTEILMYFRNHYAFSTIVDIGCGAGLLWPPLKDKAVTAVGLNPRASLQLPSNVTYHEGDFFLWKRERQFDAVFSSHVIEHIQNTRNFLKAFFECIPDGKPWCLIWPPPKKEIVPGHYHVFSLGIMLYNVIRMGIDCRYVDIFRCKYSLALSGLKKSFVFPEANDGPSIIDQLSDRFPFKATNAFDGDNPPGVIKL